MSTYKGAGKYTLPDVKRFLNQPEYVIKQLEGFLLNILHNAFLSGVRPRSLDISINVKANEDDYSIIRMYLYAAVSRVEELSHTDIHATVFQNTTSIVQFEVVGDSIRASTLATGKMYIIGVNKKNKKNSYSLRSDLFLLDEIDRDQQVTTYDSAFSYLNARDITGESYYYVDDLLDLKGNSRNMVFQDATGGHLPAIIDFNIRNHAMSGRYYIEEDHIRKMFEYFEELHGFTFEEDVLKKTLPLSYDFLIFVNNQNGLEADLRRLGFEFETLGLFIRGDRPIIQIGQKIFD